jgi:alpha,alpha-trehalose phosphorylase
MARLNLNWAAMAVRRLSRERPADYAALCKDVGLDDDEIADWEQAAAAMYVPYDAERGVHPQDESFLEREVWDLQTTPRERFPLLLHYHPLVIYRYQVLKQADVVLAMYLLGNEFDAAQKRRNFDYYDPLTTGDSSLSACMQAIVAAEIGNEAKALEYFDYALMMDLADLAGNVSDGVHVASTGGVWQALVFGFGGVRDYDGALRIDPRLPSSWDRLAFPLRFRDRQLRIELTHDRETYALEEGDDLEVTVRGEAHWLRVESPLEIVLGSEAPEAASSAVG